MPVSKNALYYGQNIAGITLDDLINKIILSSMSDGVLVIGFDGRIVFINPAAADLLNISEREAIQKNYTDLFLSESRNDPFNDVLFDGIQNRETRAYCEVPFFRSDGKLLDLALTSSFLRNADMLEEGQGIVVVFKDITESRALELARQRVLDHLSHELKTPLSIMKATLKRAIVPEKRELGERLEQNLKRLQDIQLAVEDIVQKKPVQEGDHRDIWLMQMHSVLDTVAEEDETCGPVIEVIRNRMSFFFPEQHNEKPRLVDISEELFGAVDRARSESSHRALTLRLHIEDDQSLVFIDPQALDKTFTALIKNAIEATPDGGSIDIASRSTDSRTIVTIKDTGIGITPQSQSQIFGGFYHARETILYSTKKPYDFGAGGKGLELLRLMMFAEACRFGIQCESKRCVFLADESILCPGSVEACIHVQNADECEKAGGTVFTLKFDGSKP